MSVTQVRLPKKLTDGLDLLVTTGSYETRSDVVRDAVRRFLFEKNIFSLDISGDPVKEVRKIRKKLSKESVNLNELNALE